MSAPANENGVPNPTKHGAPPLPDSRNGEGRSCPTSPTRGEEARSEEGGAPSSNGGNGRDGRGRFASGNRGGPGNPFARQTAALRRAFLAVVTPQDLEAVARAVVQRAREGDMAAAKLLLLYAIGKPTEAVDPDTLDVREWELFQQGQATAEQMTAAMGGLPLELACHMVRAARGPLADAKAQLMAQTLAEGQTPPEEAADDEVAASGVAAPAVATSVSAEERTVPGAAGGERPAPERRAAPKPSATGDGRRSKRAANEAANQDARSAPNAEMIERLLGKDFAVGGEIALESAEDFRRNLLRDG